MKKSSSKKQGGGKGGGNWEAPSFDARSDRKKNRKPRSDNKKKTRAPRNGYGKSKSGPKKGGAGAHNWGSVADAGKEYAENSNGADNNSGDDGEKAQVEEEDNTLSFEEFQKMKLEKRKKSDIFAAREVRTTEGLDGTAYKKKYESDVYTSQKKKTRKNKKLSDASNFFSSVAATEDRGNDRRGGDKRGRGRGGKGKKADRKPRQKRQPAINLQNMNEFPSL